MILSEQQKFMLAAIQRLGCVRRDQLVALFRPAFCAASPGAEEGVVDSALYRLRCCCQQVRVSNGVWSMSNAKENQQLLEAVDVMIELSGAKPLDYQKAQPPALLRFTVQEQKIRRFVVAAYGEDPAFQKGAGTVHLRLRGKEVTPRGQRQTPGGDNELLFPIHLGDYEVNGRAADVTRDVSGPLLPSEP